MSRLFTSESVTEGHPDKVADSISDAVLDAMLTQDASSRTAVETLVANGVVIVTGEATTDAYVDIAELTRSRLVETGYDSAAKGLDGNSCGVMVALNAQSPDIAQGVDDSWETRHGSTDPLDRQGAGDQGLMFGYACTETENLMPLPIDLAHRLSERLAFVRHNGLDQLRPDGKTQVTIEYDDAGKPVRLDTVLVSAQHQPNVSLHEVTQLVTEEVITPILDNYGLEKAGVKILVNPTGKFVIGGPMGDAGLTGRKIIVDTYGGMARHGGGAFSGKDASKVDRSASYAMRWIAKNVVAAGLADRCEVQVSYAIGKANAVGFFVDTFGTGVLSDARLSEMVREVFDLRPAALIAELELCRPIFQQTTNYGHFGREFTGATWELTNRVEALKSLV